MFRSAFLTFVPSAREGSSQNDSLRGCSPQCDSAITPIRLYSAQPLALSTARFQLRFKL